jgi:acyl-CoA thioester hydrolase
MSKEITKEYLSQFGHKIDGTVEFADCDAFGVVHNVKYLYWLERARTEYFRYAGLQLGPETFISENRYMVVHADIDYFSALRFTEKYSILTRVSFIKNSSIGFENIVINDYRPVVKAGAVLVHLDENMNPSRIPDNFRDKVIEIEKKNVRIID